MRCPRCTGLMAPYVLMDSLNSMERTCEAWRCVNCGEIMDPVLLENRIKSPDAEVARTKRRWTGVLAA